MHTARRTDVHVFWTIVILSFALRAVGVFVPSADSNLIGTLLISVLTEGGSSKGKELMDETFFLLFITLQ